MYYVGIDPGKKGGIAVIDVEHNSVKFLIKMPEDENKEELKEFLTSLAPLRDLVGIKVITERPILKPHFINKPCSRCRTMMKTAVMQQGVMTSLINYGIILGFLYAYEIPFEEVESAKWKKAFKLDKDKSKSIKLAKQLFPSVTNDIKSHDGMAEALLIAEYGRRNL